MKFLNLGCGTAYHKDWINIDFKSNNENIIECNLLDGIPLKEASVDVVYHSHVLEHFSKKDGVNFLKECYRVLKPDGIIRIAVPDLEVIAREYLKNLELSRLGNPRGKLNYDWIKLELLDQLTRHESGGSMLEYLRKIDLPNEDYIIDRLGQEVLAIREGLKIKTSEKQSIKKSFNYRRLIKVFFRKIKNLYSDPLSRRLSQEQLQVEQVGSFRLGGEVHQWMYDDYSLSTALMSLGFKEINKVDAFQSNIPRWELYNLDSVDGRTRKPDSLFIEARKL